MRRTDVGLTVLALSIVGALAICGCGGGGKGPAPPPVSAPSQGPFVGADVCSNCHSDVHTEWLGTMHSQAFAALQSVHADTNPNCLGCHVLGYKQPTGFVNAATTPQFENVQCENCHGSGGNHITNPGANPMTIDLSSTKTCAQCHTGSRHPQYDQWTTSKHAAALTNLVNSSAKQNSCLLCHSVESVLQQTPPVVLPAQTVATDPVTCLACHDPHSAANTNQLLAPPQSVCLSCHSDQGAQPGMTPNLATVPLQSQSEIQAGIGGFDANGNPLVGPNSAHATSAPASTMRCVTCHVYAVQNPTPPVENASAVDHTFEPHVPAVCVQCHYHASTTSSTNHADVKMPITQAGVQASLNALSPYFTSGNPKYINPSHLSATQLTSYNAALFDYYLVLGDKSLGVHNAKYVRNLLSVATTIVTGLPK